MVFLFRLVLMRVLLQSRMQIACVVKLRGQRLCSWLRSHKMLMPKVVCAVPAVDVIPLAASGVTPVGISVKQKTKGVQM